MKEKSVQWFVFKQLALDFNLRFDICFWSFVLIVNAYNHCSNLNRICIKVSVRCFTSNLNTTCSVEVGLLSQTYILCSWKWCVTKWVRHRQKKVNCVTELKLYTLDKLSSTIFCCLCVFKGSVTPDQISSFSIYTGTKALYWVTHSTLGLVS